MDNPKQTVKMTQDEMTAHLRQLLGITPEVQAQLEAEWLAEEIALEERVAAEEAELERETAAHWERIRSKSTQ